jgi:hypothetical protein
MKVKRDFIKGKMNKSFDERLVVNGEYIDAMNIRLGSTEESEFGAIENTKGNEKLTSLTAPIDNQPLSNDAICLGSIEDSANETIYWFVHDPSSSSSPVTGKLDMIVAYDVVNNVLTYNVVSFNDGGGVNTTLNFDPLYRVNGVNLIDDLLFFTDNYNPPRRINVNRLYYEPKPEDLNVIVMPPSQSPSINLINVPGEENYLDTRFISFAYRYKYLDGEYSALSQFSEIAFAPLPFQLDPETFSNEGMTNQFNSAQITMNTGSDRVVGIDLVFKFSNGTIINIVEKYVKEDEGWGNNTDVVVTFTNRKVYTTLPESELLRLFDNVPHKAQAQTIMGNRLMYGNYVDGYDLIDADGNNCLFNYETELISTPVDQSSVSRFLSDTTYNIDPSSTEIIPNSTLSIDMSDFSSELIDGGVFSITIRLSSSKLSGTGTLPTYGQSPLTISIIFNLQENYSSVYEMVSSTLFLQTIGQFTFTPITDCGTDSAGNSLTDRFNCQLTDLYLPSPGYDFNNSGITGINQGIRIISTPGSDIFSLSMLAARYELFGTPGVYVYEYFQILSSTVTFSKYGIEKSLHSDRDFEVGIVYMDEYNRSTTTLVSSDNTVFIPPSASIQKNIIRTTIPTTQKPPYWATRYKFVVKPSSIDYETIYSNIFFTDPLDNITYFLLEGDNQTKAIKGQRIRVKKDVGGPVLSRVETVILDISAKSRNFLPDDNENITEPSGLYMSIKANNFNLNTEDLNYLTSGRRDSLYSLLYPVYSNNPSYDVGSPISPTNVPYKAWEIPSGSLVTFSFRMATESVDDPDYGNATYTFEKTFTASMNYDNIYSFIIGDNIILNNGAITSDEGLDPNVYQFDNLYDFTTGTGGYNYITFGTVFPGVDYESFRVQLLWRNPLEATPGDSSAGQMYFGLRNLNDVPGSTETNVSCEIIVISGGNNIVFETLPIDSDPDIYYEGSDSYPITGGFHDGNIQNQTAVDPAIIDLSFFNCFTFGNGVESYKIRDGLATPNFRLGERTTAVSQEDYKGAHRFADITYSGIYNEDTNINKLNEFNLALGNFKTLEKSFGPIRVMSGRASDILVLQEDKVSYVLKGKNLLSDAAGGGAISSIPEVLGTNIVRIENYGISNNPESYTEWGFEKYFTDTKRGALIKLTGNGTQEQLSVISNLGMRSWFRDYFNLTPNTQKLGGYDPYMNEYVISGNLNAIPTQGVEVPCGITRTLTTSETLTSWIVVFPLNVGTVSVSFYVGTIPVGESITLNVTYNGITYSSGPVTSSLFFSLPKSSVIENTALVEVILSSSYETTYSVNVGCPLSNQLQVTQVGLNSDDMVGQFIHNEFYWAQGSYVSPTRSSMIMLMASNDTINVSQFDILSGNEGSGMIPPSGGSAPTTIRIQSNKKGSDDFVFNPNNHKLRYLLSAIEYENNPADIQAMLSASTELTPLVNPTNGLYYYDINYVQSAVFEPYLYLIYDYQDVEEEVLCYSNTSALEACCSCVTCEGSTPYNSSLTPQVDSTAACTQALTETLYHSGSEVCPVAGDNVHQDSDMSIPVLSGYYKVDCGWIEVTPDGVVNSNGTC